MKPEWIALHDELHASAHELVERMKPIFAEMSKIKQKKNLFWAQIQLDLDDFRNMDINEETKDINIYD